MFIEDTASLGQDIVIEVRAARPLRQALGAALSRVRAAFAPDPFAGMDPRLARDIGVEPRPEPVAIFLFENLR